MDGGIDRKMDRQKDRKREMCTYFAAEPSWYVQWLNDTGIAESVRPLRRRLSSLHKALLPHLASWMPPGANLSFSAMIEAYDSHPFPPSSLTHLKIRSIPAAQEPAVLLQQTHLSPELSGRRYTLVKMRHFVVHKNEQEAQAMFVMVPVADMVNHCSMVRGIWRVENSSQTCRDRTDWIAEESSFTLYAGKPFQKGDEICHSYSHSSCASDFFLNYGFVTKKMFPKVYLSAHNVKGEPMVFINGFVMECAVQVVDSYRLRAVLKVNVSFHSHINAFLLAKAFPRCH